MGPNGSNGTIIDSLFGGPPGGGRGGGRGGGGNGPRPPRQPRSNPAGQSSGAGKTLGIVVTIISAVALVVVFLSKIWTEFAWFNQLQRLSVILTTWGWGIGLVVGGTLLAAAVTWISLAVAGKASPYAEERAKAANRRNAEKKMDEAKRQAEKRKAAEDSAEKPATDKTSPTDKTGDDKDHVVDLDLEFDAEFDEKASRAFEEELRRDMRREARPGVTSLRDSFEPWRKALIVIAPLVAGVFVALPLASQWQQFAAWWHRTDFGTKDPIFGRDASFFVFSLPVYSQVTMLVFNILVMAGIFTLARYYLQGNLSTSIDEIPNRTRIHISILLALLAAVFALRYYLQRFELLMGSHDKFSGASYTDIHAVLPAKNILVGISLVIAVLFVIGAFRKSWIIPATGVGVMVLSAILVGGLYPFLIQRFQVDPSAQELEAPYISNNIKATRDAFGIADVKEETYKASTEATAGQLRQDSESTASIRLLDPSVVSRTFGQLEQNRQYYRFAPNLAVDRYVINDKAQDTVIAVRELDTNQLGDSQKSWVNQHTVFTHGFGVVTAYGSKVNADGSPAFWEHGIPSTGELGEYEPRIYFGQYSPDYSIVGSPKGGPKQEFDYPSDTSKDKGVNNTFTGDGGPTVGNSWERLMYAIKFQASEIFFSQQVNEASQILFYRNPEERVAKVAPYLTLDSKAYPAVVDMDGNPKTPKRVVWIIDAYTTSNSYPYSTHIDFTNSIMDSRTSQYSFGVPNAVNYVRNSVKAVVDAYDGSVTLYQWDAKDPVVNAWSKVFPGQLKSVSEVPGDLMAHFRYPEDMFKVQRNLISRYHTTDPRSFYSGSDFWKLPDDPTHEGSTTVMSALQPPYYLTMQAPGAESTEFSLYSTYIPYGQSDRNVLTGYLTVDSETGSEAGKVRPEYGKIRLLSLPSDLAVPGPGQVSNKFKTTDNVSRTLNLLSQQSTEVVRGNLLTLPVGGGLLYVQPVYVQGKSGTTYPLLRFVLTSFGDKIGFAPTLKGSLDQLFGGDSGAVTSEEGGGAASGGGTPAAPTLTPAQQLQQALQGAKSAMDAADQAMKAGDWAAYGKAQTDLKAQLQKAVELQGEAAAGGAAAAGDAAGTGDGAAAAVGAAPDATPAQPVATSSPAATAAAP